MTDSIRVTARGRAVVNDPQLNKGTAFSEDERRALGIDGLLPGSYQTLEGQVARVRGQYDLKTTDLERHIFLRALQDTNEVLFYAFLTEHLEQLLPIVYTPTVGDACREFSHIYRRPLGIFIPYPDRDHMGELLDNAPARDVDVIVVTDGERILGLGDQGVGGMGIPIGKLSLYTVAGGIDPKRTLPIILDVGTNNADLLDDPLYVGWRHERIVGSDYGDFVECFVASVETRFPGALLQWEDFAQTHAAPLLERYRSRLLSFNDDIQGTAAVALAVTLSGLRRIGGSLRDQRVCIVGAGSAGTGIAEQLVRAMTTDGLDEDGARSRIFMVDRHGLVHDAMTGLLPIQEPLAQPFDRVAGWASSGDSIDLLNVVTHAKPTVLIGVSGQPGIFTREIVSAMAGLVERPIILPLSNPTSRAEAAPEDILTWTKGRALVATGSPFAPVRLGGVMHQIAQANNVYVFPGLGLGTIAVAAGEVTDGMIMAAAGSLAEISQRLATDEGSPLLPPLADVRAVSETIAVAVATQAVKEGIAGSVPEDIAGEVHRRMWEPVYRPMIAG